MNFIERYGYELPVILLRTGMVGGGKGEIPVFVCSHCGAVVLIGLANEHNDFHNAVEKK